MAVGAVALAVSLLTHLLIASLTMVLAPIWVPALLLHLRADTENTAPGLRHLARRRTFRWPSRRGPRDSWSGAGRTRRGRSRRRSRRG
jgi:hypothetical protein